MCGEICINDQPSTGSDLRIHIPQTIHIIIPGGWPK